MNIQITPLNFGNSYPNTKNQSPTFKYWTPLECEDGYKIQRNKDNKVYSIEHNPRRHAPNTLLIRTIDKEHKLKGKITSFRVEFNDMKEVRQAYKNIVQATGFEKILEITKLLELQAWKNQHKYRIK